MILRLALRARSGLAISSLALVLAACGSKGDPLPPYRPAPGKAEAVTATRIEGGPITLRFTVPAANADGTSPVDITAIRVFAVTKPAGEAPPTPADLAGGGDATQVATVSVLTPPLGGVERDAPAPSMPTPGSVITWEDTTEAANVYPTAMVRYYAVAGVSRRNRVGPASEVIAVPLTAVPDAPSRLTASFTEKAIKLDWLGAAAGTRYRIYEVIDGKPAAVPLHPEPQAGTSYEDPRLEFGTERCYVVRAAVTAAGASVESAAAGPVCITPRDVFPPPAPGNLTAVAGSGAISLIWDAVDAPDFGGYLLLRGEVPGDTLLPPEKLEPLFAAPITDTTYKDATTVAGTRYVYAVVAVDKATPPNRSAESNRVQETGR